MNETQFQSVVMEYAQLRGWKRFHPRTAAVRRGDGSFRHMTPMSGDEGYPDLTLVRNGRFVFLELKSEKGQASDAQVAWLNEMVDYTGPWRSRGEVPDGAAFHVRGGWSDLQDAGDWMILVALARPRHKDWILEMLK